MTSRGVFPLRRLYDTRFLCFGAASGFGSIEFEVEITEVAAYLVQDFRESLPCMRDFLANLPDDQVSTVFDETSEMSSISGLVPCL